MHLQNAELSLPMKNTALEFAQNLDILSGTISTLCTFLEQLSLQDCAYDAHCVLEQSLNCWLHEY